MSTGFQIPRGVVANVTANATLAKGKHTPVDATSGAITMTLPTGATPGSVISVEKVDSSTNAVTVSGSIRGTASTVTLVWQYETVEFVADSAGSWRPVAGHKTKAALDGVYMRADVVAAAATGVAATDTANLQAAITATPANGWLHIPRGRYFINATLVLSKNMRVTGAGVLVSSGNYEDDPQSSPYLNGTVLNMVTAATDAISIPGTAPHVDLANFGITFDTSIMGTNTGHGINATPPTISGGRGTGLSHSRWDGVWIHGHDGNHYAYRIVNPLENTLIDLRWWGGGGIYIGSSSNGVNYGNTVVIHPVGIMSCGGSADAFHQDAPVQTGLGLLNLMTWIQPQCNIEGPQWSGVTAVTASQSLWKDNGYPRDVAVYAPDLENDLGGVTCPTVFSTTTYVTLAGGYMDANVAYQSKSPRKGQPTVAIGGGIGSAANGAAVSFSNSPTGAAYNDERGTISITCASGGQYGSEAPLALVTLSTIRTFGAVMLTPRYPGIGAALGVYVKNAGPGYFEIWSHAGLAASTTYSFDYHVIE